MKSQNSSEFHPTSVETFSGNMLYGDDFSEEQLNVWYPRRELTNNERGIPYRLFKLIVTDVDFRMEHSALFDFAPFARIMAEIGMPAFINPFITRAVRLLSLLFPFNTKYHHANFIQRFRPASLALVLRKPTA